MQLHLHSPVRRRFVGRSWFAGLVAATLALAGSGSDSSATSADPANPPESTAESSTPAETSHGSDAPASGDPIRVGSVLDITGQLSAYGGAMNNAAELAIEDINANGGVLGRPLELVSKDSQSDNAQYTLHARALADDDDIVVVHGGITSASREAIRPIFDEAELLYFYAPLYEGGVCDKNTFVTGETPTQQLEPLLQWAIENGKTKWYVLAANYNFGQISALWAEKLAQEYGAEIVGGPTFFDLTVDNFSDQIPQIQASGADLIVSFLVGPAHLNFYKQWAATGLNETTTIVSTSFGFGEEQVALGADGEGILVAYPYFAELDTPASEAFRDLWAGSGFEGTITPGAISIWNGWHLWAAAANAAGTVERDAVIAQLEEGVSYDGPAGTITMEGGAHHAVVPMRLWIADGSGGFALEEELTDAAVPTFEQEQCDLIASPDTNEQFTP